MIDIFETSKENQLKPSLEYSPHVAPRAFRLTNCFASNALGDILFAVRIEFSIVQNNDTGIHTFHKNYAETAKYQVKSGKRWVFSLDPKLTNEDLFDMMSFYVLNDFLGVMVTYNHPNYMLKQHLLLFDHKLKVARRIYERRVPLNELAFDFKVGLGEIGRGRIQVYGSRGPMNGEREVVAYSLSADPRPLSVVKYPDINLTAQIAEFVTLLKADLPDCKIFPSGIFVKDNYMYFLIKEQVNSTITLHTIGRMKICEKEEGKRKTPSKDCYKLLTATGHIRYSGFMNSYELALSVHRGRNVWLTFYVPHWKEFLTFSWILHFITLPIIHDAINLSLSFGRRMHRLDGGWTLRLVQKCLLWIYGPTRTPVTAPPMIYEVYNLDLETMVYKKVNYEPNFGKSGANTYPLPVCMDSDTRGGLLLWETSTSKEQQLNVRYFVPPHQPETLARLAENMIYRKSASYKKDEILRRSLEICDFKWKL